MIQVEHLTKKFDDVVAVNDISFVVKEGQSFGFLGPNGAGKTTTIRILTTLLPPTSGKARIAGLDVTKASDRVREKIGIIFQDPSLDERLTAYDNLYFHAALYRVPRREIRSRIDKALAMVELLTSRHKVVKTFSGGMKRRLEIARGFLHMPRVLFLDEPTIGLDPQTRKVIWEYINELKRDFGVTLFLTTHYMEEADDSDRVGIIHQGAIVSLDSPERLKRKMGGAQIVLPSKDENERKLKNLKIAFRTLNDHVYIDVADGSVRDTLNRMIGQSINLDEMIITQPTLEDVFIKLTGTAIREEAAGPMEHLRMVRRVRGKNR
ncbi:MAG: ATP-binding cassette domain-containing protein [Deltaproteobacteria bacterium]|nr:ATP-binding cassette domain-containing protein [Candidatus Zymogenaceae bacterium]